MPFTLRLMYHTFRAGMLALMLTITAWVALVPATPKERTAMGASIGTERPPGLAQMRVARAFVHFAPNRAARMLSRSSNGEISEELAGMLLRDLANGPASQTKPVDAGTSERVTGRPDVGAKFVRVD